MIGGHEIDGDADTGGLRDDLVVRLPDDRQVRRGPGRGDDRRHRDGQDADRDYDRDERGPQVAQSGPHHRSSSSGRRPSNRSRNVGFRDTRSSSPAGRRPPSQSQSADLVEEPIADGEDSCQRKAEDVGIEPARRQLHREDRSLVLAHPELDERELLVPAEEAAIRLAEQVVDRRRVVGPADQPDSRVEDQRDAEIEAATAVEHEVPRDDTVAVGSLEGLEPQVAQPALHVGRTEPGRREVGRGHGGQSSPRRRPEPRSSLAAATVRLAAASAATCRRARSGPGGDLERCVGRPEHRHAAVGIGPAPPVRGRFNGRRRLITRRRSRSAGRRRRS